MLKFGEGTIKQIIVIILFGIIAFSKDITLSYLLKNNSLFAYFAFVIGFGSKLFSGVLECLLRRSFKYSMKKPSSLSFKDYITYMLIIVLEVIVISQVWTFKNGIFSYEIFFLFPMLMNCQIFIIGFSSYLILDYKFGNHKIAGLIISFVGMIVILYFFPLVYFIEQRLQNLIITLVIVITGGLTEVLEKYLLVDKNQNPYLLICITGIPQTIILVIYLFFLQDQYILEITVSNIIFFILCIISQSLYHYMRIVINYKYTPSLKIIADSFSLTLSFIIILFIPIQHKEFLRSYAIAGIIGYCICLIGGLIYNEIIIITVWNLDHDTAEGIKERALIEQIEDISIFNSEREKTMRIINATNYS